MVETCEYSTLFHFRFFSAKFLEQQIEKAKEKDSDKVCLCFLLIIWSSDYYVVDCYLMIVDWWSMIDDRWLMIVDWWYVMNDQQLMIGDLWLMINDSWLMISDYWLTIDCWSLMIIIDDWQLMIDDWYGR